MRMRVPLAHAQSLSCRSGAKMACCAARSSARWISAAVSCSNSRACSPFIPRADGAYRGIRRLPGRQMWTTRGGLAGGAGAAVTLSGVTGEENRPEHQTYTLKLTGIKKAQNIEFIKHVRSGRLTPRFIFVWWTRLRHHVNSQHVGQKVNMVVAITMWSIHAHVIALIKNVYLIDNVWIKAWPWR